MDLSPIALATAFAAGAISFLSPCVLPLVPGYLSFVAGRELDGVNQARKEFSVSDLGTHSLFVLGFTTVFVALGVGVSAFGGLLLRFQWEATMGAGALLIVLGILMTGLVRLPFLERELRWHGPRRAGGPGTAYLVGIAFALGWTPCIGPILAAILALAAANPGQGAFLLAVYSFGLGLPFLMAAFLMGHFSRRIISLKRTGIALRLIAGSTMAIMGLLMVTGQMSLIAIWFIETFPALSRLG
ncbi:cytochrome c biogenesis CcdA family protein [Microvirga sp. VF16]|uniref:cytochrome c biogenesis CcdA family protein n=1 Tax=Microvirga sp. VF16 TaxID=2807101 RepID=UPI00193C99F3|nr:cytochrome c biogenesis protein CcdA [Microvirga sp. VF16]QRM35268.1 sulfite exporter TauE/SafE family protein [Microvirga sp. VF16]